MEQPLSYIIPNSGSFVAFFLPLAPFCGVGGMFLKEEWGWRNV